MLGLRYRQVVTLKRSRITAIGFWIVSIISSSLFFNLVIISWSVQYIIAISCLLTTIFAYTKILFSLCHIQNRVDQGQPSQAIPALNVARYRKAVYNTLWLQVTLVACYLPYVIVVALQPQKGTIPISAYIAEEFTVTLVYLNSSLNPLLYCWKIREVRQAVKETVRQVFPCSVNLR